MTPDAITWVVVADGAHARILQELRRGARLLERPQWLVGLSRRQHHSHGAPGRVYDRMGYASHAVGRDDYRSASETAFVRALARKLNLLANRKPVDHIVLIAPPRALGVLRGSLGTQLTRRVVISKAGEHVRSTPSQLADVLRRARLAH